MSMIPACPDTNLLIFYTNGFRVWASHHWNFTPTLFCIGAATIIWDPHLQQSSLSPPGTQLPLTHAFIHISPNYCHMLVGTGQLRTVWVIGTVLFTSLLWWGE